MTNRRSYSLSENRRRLETYLVVFGISLVIAILSTQGVYSNALTLGNGGNTLLSINGSTIQSPDVIVYRSGSTYYAENGTSGQVMNSNSDASTLINSVTGPFRNIFVKSGVYIINSPITLSYTQRGTFFELDKGAIFLVPQGYSSQILVVKDTYLTRFEGGQIDEAGTPQRLWTGFWFIGSNNGNSFNEISDVKIFNCGTCLELTNNGPNGFVNANEFRQLKMFDFIKGIVFDPPMVGGTNVFQYNNFVDVEAQSESYTTYCVQNISTKGESFINFHCWDMPATGHDATIASGTTNTIILGGLLTQTGFIDGGTGTQILDYYAGERFGFDLNMSNHAIKNVNEILFKNGGLGGNPYLYSNSAVQKMQLNGQLETTQDVTLDSPSNLYLLGGDLKLASGHLLRLDYPTNQNYIISPTNGVIRAVIGGHTITFPNATGKLELTNTLQGRSLVVGGCSNGQVLEWQSSNSTWTCATVGSSAMGRESLVDQIDIEKVFSGVGTSYSDVYVSKNSHGHATLIDSNGMSTVRLVIIWQRGNNDTGIQNCQIIDDANSANVLVVSSSLTNGVNDSGDLLIPAGLTNTLNEYKVQCKSTSGIDSPTLLGLRVYLKP
jgi:hypothetical protein